MKHFLMIILCMVVGLLVGVLLSQPIASRLFQDVGPVAITNHPSIIMESD
jgi:uncharacterized protein YneF (UPF0154 family)